MPLRGTKTSAGYDFFATMDITIKPQEKALFWTNIKAYMQPNEVLILDVRSSVGIKLDLALANTLAIIDGDYVDNPDNEGNIGICLRNLRPEMRLNGFKKITCLTAHKEGYIIVDIPIIDDLREVNTITIKSGDRVAQGIFVQFLEADNCNSEAERTGGIGSTSK